MSKTWQCGDCGCEWPETVNHCPHALDDYLSLRGGSIESAITLAVETAIAPIVKAAEDRLSGATYWSDGNAFHWRWAA